MILGTLNPEKVWHENLADLSTSSVRSTHFTLRNPKKSFATVLFIHTSQKKTNCNPLGHPTWKYHHTNLWNAKLFHLTEGLLRSFKRWRLRREPVVGCHRGSEKNRFWCVAIRISGKQRHSKCSEWPPSVLVHASSLFRHWSVLGLCR